MRKCSGGILFGLTVITAALLLAGPVYTADGVYDATDDGIFIDQGFQILSVDYVHIIENDVLEDGTDYPYGRIWIAVYDPDPYEKMDNLSEESWERSDEYGRYALPGPSDSDRWADGDEMAYLDAGVHEWVEGSKDRIVFRIFVEEPGYKILTDTLMWGVVEEDDTIGSTTSYTNDSLSINFRTLNFPEIFLPPVLDFKDAWLEHEVSIDGSRGLSVHSEFQIDNMRTKSCRIAVYVHYADDTDPVMSQLDDPDFSTPSGLLTAQEDFMPIYTFTIFSDYPVFIPYDAFPISDDFVEYTASVEILDSDGDYIGSMETPVFSVLRPE